MKKHNEALWAFIIGMLIPFLMLLFWPDYSKPNNPEWNEISTVGSILIGLLLVNTTTVRDTLLHPRVTLVFGFVAYIMWWNTIIIESPDQTGYFLLGGFTIGLLLGIVARNTINNILTIFFN